MFRERSGIFGFGILPNSKHSKEPYFKFERTDNVWASGDRKETQRMRIERTHEDGTIESYSIVKLEPTNPNEVFVKQPRTETMETIHVHLAPITGRTSSQYFEVRQISVNPKRATTH